MGVPMCSVAYVQKGYMVSDFIDIWNWLWVQDRLLFQHIYKMFDSLAHH